MGRAEEDAEMGITPEEWAGLRDWGGCRDGDDTSGMGRTEGLGISPALSRFPSLGMLGQPRVATVLGHLQLCGEQQHRGFP